MSEKQQFIAKKIGLFKCEHCNGLHISCEVNENVEVIAVLDAPVWADMFLHDEEFRQYISKKLSN